MDDTITRMKQSRAGDKQAFGALVEQHVSMLVGVAYRMVGDQGIAIGEKFKASIPERRQQNTRSQEELEREFQAHREELPLHPTPEDVERDYQVNLGMLRAIINE